MAGQQPPSEPVPNRLPGPDDPAVEGIEAEQATPDDPPVPAAALPEPWPVVFAVFAVSVLGISPGNCTAVSGSVDDALVPPLDTVADPCDPEPVVADPVATDPEAALIADPPGAPADEPDVSDAFGVFDAFELQPDPAVVPLDVPEVEHGVETAFVPAGTPSGAAVADGVAALVPG